MDTFFFVCFGVGVGYALISFVLGGLLGQGEIDGGLEVAGELGDLDGLDGDLGDLSGLDGGLELDTEFELSANVSPFKPVVIAAFLTVFGGSGMLLYPGWDVWIAVVSAFVLGFIVAFLLYRGLIVPLHRAQNTSTVGKQAVIGETARVIVSIPQGDMVKSAIPSSRIFTLRRQKVRRVTRFR